MSFPGFKNSFSEEVTDAPKTNYDCVANDDFLLNNTVELTTKMKLREGSFKLKNVVRTKEEEGAVSYSVSADATIEHNMKHNIPDSETSIQAKLKAKSLQFHFDFPKTSIYKGSVNPYFRLGMSSTFKNLVPSAGYIYAQDNFKLHGRITKTEDNVTYEENGVYKKNAWTLHGLYGLQLKNFALNYYRALAAWNDNDSEVSIECGKDTQGLCKPDYINFNLWFAYKNYNFAVQVANSGEKYSNRLLKGTYKYNLSKDLWFKTSLDHKYNCNNYSYLNWNGVQIGLTAGMNLKSNEGFNGYLDYPFNWGLSFKFAA